MHSPSDSAPVDYAGLTPDTLLDAVEQCGWRTSGRFLALNSYENRVYQIGLDEGPPIVAKFYRPGRWSSESILEEHALALELAQQEIPDARQRLRHVIDMTDQAAHRTLNAVEESLPICEELESRSRTLQEDWQRFKKRDMDINEFKQLAKRLDEFFTVNTGDAGKLRSSLNNVLMAQDFQDLTSQIIKKVIKLVEEVESNLVELIKLTRTPAEVNADTQRSENKQTEKLAGPVVPGVNDSGSTVSGQDEVDDLLSSLGF